MEIFIVPKAGYYRVRCLFDDFFIRDQKQGAGLWVGYLAKGDQVKHQGGVITIVSTCGDEKTLE